MNIKSSLIAECIILFYINGKTKNFSHHDLLENPFEIGEFNESTLKEFLKLSA